MAKFRLKPTELIEARQFLNDYSTYDLLNWIKSTPNHPFVTCEGGLLYISSKTHRSGQPKDFLFASPGDWILRDLRDGNFYPCQPDLFHSLYEAVKEEPAQPTGA